MNYNIYEKRGQGPHVKRIWRDLFDADLDIRKAAARHGGRRPRDGGLRQRRRRLEAARKSAANPTSCVPPCQILLRLDRVLFSLGVLMGSEIGPATKARWYVMHKIVDAVHTCTDTVHVYIYIYMSVRSVFLNVVPYSCIYLHTDVNICRCREPEHVWHDYFLLRRVGSEGGKR